MKMSTTRLFVCILFFSLIAANTGSILYTLWQNNFTPQSGDTAAALPAAEDDRPETHGFPETEKAPDADRSAGWHSASDKLVKIINNASAKIDTYCNRLNPFSETYGNLYGRFSRLIGKRVVETEEGDIYLLNNGHLTLTTPERDEHFCNAQQENLLDFKRFLDELDIDLIQISCPSKADESRGQFPEGADTHFRENTEIFDRFLKNNGIRHLDLTQRIIDEKLDFYGMFYATDHHWTCESGLWASEKIAEFINGEFAWDLDLSLFSANNYTEDLYEDSFVGSYGKMAPAFYDSADDMSILIPKFDTDYRMDNAALNFAGAGDFEEIFLFREYLESDANKYKHYYTFMGGNHPLVRIENNLCTNGRRICVIRTSMANVLLPYLSASVQYIDAIDPRHFKGSIRDFITETKPDLVLSIILPPSTAENSSADFHFK